MGRCMQDIIFLVILGILYQIRLAVYGGPNWFDIDSLGDAFVFVILWVIGVILVELAIAIFKRVLKLFRWQIL